jgi:flagellar export protein FliJ
MKRFVFRLDSIVRLRARDEAGAREILEHSLNEQRRAQADLDAACLELERCEQTIVAQRATHSSANAHLIHLNAATAQRAHCQRLAARLAKATQETAACRKQFETARRKHQAILRLHDRHLQAHSAVEQRREENEISDLILSRHAPADSRAIA